MAKSLWFNHRRQKTEHFPPLVYDTSYEQAFDALKDGDFITAVALLEQAARETGYTSDVIHHAYTLALYHADNKARLAEVSFRIGNSLEPAEWIPIASDVETRIQMFEPLTGLGMGLESASTVAATFGNLYKVAGTEFLGALCEIMNRCPKHFPPRRRRKCRADSIPPAFRGSAAADPFFGSSQRCCTASGM